MGFLLLHSPPPSLHLVRLLNHLLHIIIKHDMALPSLSKHKDRIACSMLSVYFFEWASPKDIERGIEDKVIIE